MKQYCSFTFLILCFLLIVNEGKSQNTELTQPYVETAFPKGDKVNNNNFTGTVYVYMMVTPDSAYHTSIGNVTFEPKARTNWHKHPGGQILLVTDGSGFYQEKGKPAQSINKGDVIRIPANTEHWHGAAPNSGLTHIAISLNLQKGGVEWLQAVTDEEYNK
jgi:quercetin dioxygenase-like cupin family protein